MSFVKRVFLLIALSLHVSLPAYTCTWSVGYFYQVTALRGQVVGTNVTLLQSFRWLRQSISRKHATLSLYEYRWPRSRTDLPVVKTVRTDDKGSFDFGPLKTDHYTLIVDDESLEVEDWFDVEIMSLPQATQSVKIDVSPVYPDCTGGHEIVVKTQH